MDIELAVDYIKRSFVSLVLVILMLIVFCLAYVFKQFVLHVVCVFTDVYCSCRSCIDIFKTTFCQVMNAVNRCILTVWKITVIVID